MQQTSWELPEIIAVSILAAVAALGLGGLASGIAGAAAMSDIFPGESSAQLLTQATAWAGAFAALMVLVGLLVIWWHAETWSDVLDTSEDPAESDADQDAASESAKTHLLRGSTLALWAGRMTGVIALGAITYFVAYQVNLGNPGDDSALWQLRIVTIGSLVATLVMCTAGILGAIWIRRFCAQYVPIEVGEAVEV